MDVALAVVAAVAATAFTLDLLWDLAGKRRPHVAAYAVGIGLFAAATWALVVGLAFGWTGATYRVFFLFGAILNIPFLALGSMYLVVGRRSGTAMTLALGGLSAISVTLVSTVALEGNLPEGGVPTDIFPPPTEFGPRLLAAIGGGSGTVILVVLALISLLRFWRSNRAIVYGNALILAGTLVAAWGGTGVALGEAGGFALSLMLSAVLLWLGYRTAKGARAGTRAGQQPMVVLLGPSIDPDERLQNELLIQRLEDLGYEVFCPARDLENWGSAVLSPVSLMHEVFVAIDRAQALLVDLTHGYAVVASGYAVARKIPVVMASPEGTRIPGPLRGISDAEIYYHSVDGIASRFSSALPLET